MKLSKWILILGRNTGDCWQKTNDPLRKISPGSNWECCLFDDVDDDDTDHNVKSASLTSVYLGMLVVLSRSGGGSEPRRLCSTSPLLPRERNLPREATNSPTVNTRDGKHTRCPLTWSSISWPWEEEEIINEPFYINSLNVIIWGFLWLKNYHIVTGWGH